MKKRTGIELLDAVAFKLRGLLMVPPLAFLIFYHDPRWEGEIWLRSLGILLFAVALTARIYLQRFLRYRLDGERALATEGPYAWVRNPVYLANITLLAAIALLCQVPWMAPLIAIWAALIYDRAVRFEETRLLKRYGDEYAAYFARVPRWMPKRPAGGAAAEPSVPWARAILAEWQVLLLLAVPLLKQILTHYSSALRG